MAIVKFDANEWLEVYPQFKGQVTEPQLNWAFQIACTIVDNTEDSKIPYDPENGVELRKIILWLLVCHQVTLALRPYSQSGVVSSAHEGTVGIGFQVPSAQNAEYYNQTPCGETYWQIMRRYICGGRYYDTDKTHPWG